MVDLDSGNLQAELPASCCQLYQDGACVPFQTGCYQRMNALLRHCLKTVISGLLLVAFVQVRNVVKSKLFEKLTHFPQISAAMFSFILGKRIRLIKTRCSLDRSKYQETICSFDYRRLNEISNEKPKI